MIRSETIEDIEKYNYLQMQLECSKYSFQEWKQFKENEKAIKKHLLVFGNEMREAGVKDADQRTAAHQDASRQLLKKIDKKLKKYRREQTRIIERMQAAEDTILLLPDKQQETLWYFFIEGWEKERVANIMNCSIKTVEIRLKEGLAKLRSRCSE